MPTEPAYKRVLLKISGESFCREKVRVNRKEGSQEGR